MSNTKSNGSVPLQSRNRATGQVPKAHLAWVSSINEVEPVPLKMPEGVSPKKNSPKMTFRCFKDIQI